MILLKGLENFKGSKKDMSEKASDNINSQAPEPINYRGKSTSTPASNGKNQHKKPSIVAFRKRNRPGVIDSPVSDSPSPLDEMEAEFNSEEAEKERQAIREEFGDPSEALAKLLAHIRPEIIERNFPED